MFSFICKPELGLLTHGGGAKYAFQGIFFARTKGGPEKSYHLQFFLLEVLLFVQSISFILTATHQDFSCISLQSRVINRVCPC